MTTTRKTNKRGGALAVSGYAGNAVEYNLDEAMALTDKLIADRRAAEAKAITLNKSKGKSLATTLKSAQAQFNALAEEVYGKRRGGDGV